MAEVQKIVVQIEADTAKATSQVNSFSKAIEDGVNDALKEAGVSAKQLEDALKKAGSSADTGFKSLKQQIREAKEEATKLASQFGENSKQVLAAQKNVAKLTEEMDDFNQRVKALNPEAKFNAVSGALQGTLGALQGVTGALQLFGAESEDVAKIAQKLQGALNLAQGLNSVMGLKDAFSNLKLVLGATAVAQESLAVANAAEGTTAGAAAAATTGLNASLATTLAIAGPIVIAVGALVAVAYKLTQSLYDEHEAMKKVNEDFVENLKLRDLAAESYLDFVGINSKQLELMKAQGKSELEISRFKLQQIDTDLELLKAGRDRANGSATQLKFDKLINDNLVDREVLLLNINKLQEEERVKRLQSLGDVTELLKKEITFQVFRQKEAELSAKEIAKTDLELAEESAKLRSEMFRKEDEKMLAERLVKFRENAEIIASLASTAADVALTFSMAQIDAETAALEEQKNKKLISEEEYQKGVRKLRRKAAEDQKKAALFQASIDFASALINALTIKPAEAIPTSLILANVVALANIAKIAATPLPKYAKGKLPSQMRPFTQADDTLAWVGSSEAIIPANKTRAYYPTIEAIYKGHISPSHINSFVNSTTKKGQSINIDTGGIVHAIGRNKKVQLEDKAILAKMIGNEIASHIDPRRR